MIFEIVCEMISIILLCLVIGYYCLKPIKRSKPFGCRGYPVYIFVNITDPEIVSALEARGFTILGYGNTPKHDKYHITLLQLWVNRDHAWAKIFGQASFHTFVSAMIVKHLSSTSLKNSPGRYEVMGDRPNAFIAKVFGSSDPYAITNFRTAIYREIGRICGDTSVDRRKIIVDGKSYFEYCINGVPLYAVPDFYHGKGVWTPHTSCFNLGDVKMHNPQMHNKIQSMSDSDTIRMMMIEWHFKNVHYTHPMPDICIGRDCKNITVSVGQGIGRKVYNRYV